MGFEFSKDQKKVIEARNQNVIVSAAAGSGKTAVLVERIIRMILEEKDNRRVDIDRLLVVTFTEAAAAEMRERIGAAIDEALAANPTDEHLLRQSALLYKAQISTIHSFCLNVIRNNFNVIGLDPAFRVADEMELKLLEQDVLNDLFEEKYQLQDTAFLSAIEYFCKGVWDDDFREYILKIYKFSQGYPWPEEWLDGCLETYRAEEPDEVMESSWMEYLWKYVSLELEEAYKKALAAKELIHKPGGPLKYEKTIDDEICLIRALKEAPDYDTLQKLFSEVSFGRLSSAKDPADADPQLKDQVVELRNQYKSIINKDASSGLKNFFALPLKDEISKMRSIYPYMSSLIDMVREFTERYENKRVEKGIISFNDMEHYALRILYTLDEEGNRIPSNTALELQASFDEILMDEYQDCNRVQEELMSAISSESKGRYNRFMVGDVKQSIYKFRLANPDLFIEKYKCYKTDDQAGQEEIYCRRIDLHQNYRSRRSVINTVNNLFGQIMCEDLGGVEYDEDAKLFLGADYPEADEEHPLKNTASQLILRIKDEESKLSKGMQEAEMIAAKIKELMSGYLVTDKKTKEFRKLKYRDIVILVRSMGGTADGIKKVFAREGIPVSINMNSGFFDTREVQDLIQLLRVIDNPRQDIPLYGVLTKYFGGLKDEEVALIKGITNLENSSENSSEDSSEDGSEDGSENSSENGLENGLENGSENGSENGTEKGTENGKENSLGNNPQDGLDNNSNNDGGNLCLYERLLIFNRIETGSNLSEKVCKFLNFLQIQRKKSTYTPIHKLISDLVYDTGYVNYVSSMAGGAQRKANISMLISKAAAFEATSYKGVFHFIRYISQLKKIQMDEGEADVTDENSDVVRIMTIHKSKGLEFPVCFLAETHKQFNMADTKGILANDMDFGPGASYIDLNLRIKNDPLLRKVINLKIKQDVLGEELRVLYVALTRAREKLIITGVIDDAEKLISKKNDYMQSRDGRGRMSYGDRSAAKCYLDYLLPLVDDKCIFCTGEDIEGAALEEGLNKIQLLGKFLEAVEDITKSKIASLAGKDIEDRKDTSGIENGKDTRDAEDVKEAKDSKVTNEVKAKENEGDENLESEEKEYRELKARFDSSYPFSNLEGMIQKTSVSDLKKAYIDENYAEVLFPQTDGPKEYVPSFMKSNVDNISATDRGSAYHKVMELMDFFNSDVKSQINKMVEKQLISKEWADCVNTHKIEKMTESNLGRRMAEAQKNNRLFREQPFVLGLEASRVDPTFPSEELVLLQGIIDAFFFEGDDIILVDYKTDVVSQGSELMKRYKVQMDYYQEALERILGKKVKERILYSFALGECVKCG